MAVSYVLGNAWQLNWLSAEDRARLNQEPYVFCCNFFVEHWRKIGIRPTAFVFGDAFDEGSCEMLRTCLTAIEADAELRERLKHFFVCLESEFGRVRIEESRLPIQYFLREHLPCSKTKVGRSFDEPMFHYCSTFTEMVNVAWVLNRGQEIRIVGIPHATCMEHFYDPTLPADPMLDDGFGLYTGMWWSALGEMRRQGVNIVDCNFQHGKPLPEHAVLPTGKLFE